jgi:type II secretory pathway pseudopilin PulG
MSPIKSHSRARWPDSRGFSLVELMVAMSLAMMVIAAILSSYTFLGRNLVRYANQQQLEVQSRRALQMFTSDVHMANRVAYAYDTTKDITQDSTWQTLPTSSQVTFRLSTPDASGGTFVYAVTYAYSTAAGTLTRSVSSGVGSGSPPASFNATSLTLLSGLPKSGDPGGVWAGFKYLDSQGWTVTGSNYPFRIKQISMGAFTLTNGTGSAGTQSRLVGASARVVLRNKRTSY